MGRGVLPFCRSAVCVFYSPTRLGNTYIRYPMRFKITTELWSAKPDCYEIATKYHNLLSMVWFWHKNTTMEHRVSRKLMITNLQDQIANFVSWHMHSTQLHTSLVLAELKEMYKFCFQNNKVDFIRILTFITCITATK